MLLVELTINSVVNYISIDGHGLTHNYKPRILGFDAPSLSIPSNHGGYAKMTFGSISFNPLLFSGDWPPPVSCPISIYHTDTTEAARELVFVGTCHLNSFDRESIKYSIYGSDYDETIADSTAYNDTLNDVLTAILTTIPEITSVNTTLARVPSPNVTYVTSGIQLAIDLASQIAEFYSHLIHIVGGTAYVIDMKLDNGTRTLTEYQLFSIPIYQYNAPVYRAIAGNYYIYSIYRYGVDLPVTAYHTTQSQIEAALTDILTIENSPRISISIPMIAGNFLAPGGKITFPDTSHVADLLSWIRARKFVYDFLNDIITIVGEGAIAAA